MILRAGKGRSTVILNHEDYNILLPNSDWNKGSEGQRVYWQWIVLLAYIKPTDSPATRLHGQPKIRKPGVPVCPIVSYCHSPLYNLDK